jgi:hypothetical protein
MILIRFMNLLINVNTVFILFIVTDNSSMKSSQIILKKMNGEIIDFKIL